MVATGVSHSRKRPFAVFVAETTDGLRREVRHDVRRHGLPSAVDVDDVVQTAFAKLWPVYDDLDTEYAAFNYAHRTAVHALSDARRRERVRHDAWLAAVHERQMRQPLDPETEALRGLRVAAVRRALRRLPISQRNAVTLVDLAELRQSEAAEAMGVSTTTLKGLVQRGRARLRLDLQEAPALTLFARLRRPFLAPLATAPSLVVMAALCLTVLHAPVPAQVPGSGTPALARPVLTLLGPISRTVSHVQKVTVPKAAPARAAAPARPAQPPAPKRALSSEDVPGGGACVGDVCTGRQRTGDQVCVQQGSDPVCANQSVVGVCPVTAPLQPHVTCERHTDPVLDPVSPP